MQNVVQSMIMQCASVEAQILHVRFAYVLHVKRWIVEYVDEAYVELLRQMLLSKTYV